ncbi:unnamed protein product [Nippostrongylus brasiliensis]|uniref:PID domain-containing protein n=1 Tax=Nippostrongylus brasiliensis TaxID=27835 RepID=A0A0N4XDZ0_NIPBR|nr:unnamed protein product [Nippostrongylus brasiliensis]
MVREEFSIGLLQTTPVGIYFGSWQYLELANAVPVVFVKIVGTHNSANEVFHCVHFECPADPHAPPVDDRSVLAMEVLQDEMEQ